MPNRPATPSLSLSLISAWSYAVSRAVSRSSSSYSSSSVTMLLNHKLTAQCAPSSLLRQTQFVRPLTRVLGHSSSASINSIRLQGHRRFSSVVVPAAAAVSGTRGQHQQMLITFSTQAWRHHKAIMADADDIMQTADSVLKHAQLCSWLVQVSTKSAEELLICTLHSNSSTLRASIICRQVVLPSERTGSCKLGNSVLQTSPSLNITHQPGT